MKCRPRFEDSVEIEQLKSHLRAGRTNVSFISHIHVRFLSCVISLIVLPTLPSPSSAVLLENQRSIGSFHKAVFSNDGWHISIIIDCGHETSLLVRELENQTESWADTTDLPGISGLITIPLALRMLITVRLFTELH